MHDLQKFCKRMEISRVPRRFIKSSMRRRKYFPPNLTGSSHGQNSPETPGGRDSSLSGSQLFVTKTDGKWGRCLLWRKFIGLWDRVMNTGKP